MNTFQKHYLKAQKQNDHQTRKQLKEVGDDLSSVTIYTLGTFITALGAMVDFIKIIECPTDQRDYVIGGIDDLKTELEKLKAAQGN